MRLAQVSRQALVGIDLLGGRLIPRYLASFGEPSSQLHTGTRRARDQPIPLVKNVAFDEGDAFAGTDYFRLSAKLCVPDWAKKVDFQFDGGERLTLCESAAVGNAHRGICQIAEHSAMKRPHRIRVSRACFEFDRGSTCAATYDRQTEKLADWSGQFFRRHICVRIVSQIATDLAVRELVVVNFNDVIHFSARQFLYIQKSGQFY